MRYSQAVIYYTKLNHAENPLVTVSCDVKYFSHHEFLAQDKVAIKYAKRIAKRDVLHLTQEFLMSRRRLVARPISHCSHSEL